MTVEPQVTIYLSEYDLVQIQRLRQRIVSIFQEKAHSSFCADEKYLLLCEDLLSFFKDLTGENQMMIQVEDKQRYSSSWVSETDAGVAIRKEAVASYTV